MSVFREGVMLYVVGLGFGDEKDIMLRGLEVVWKCDKVYLEVYIFLLVFGFGFDVIMMLVGF